MTKKQLKELILAQEEVLLEMLESSKRLARVLTVVAVVEERSLDFHLTKLDSLEYDLAEIKSLIEDIRIHVKILMGKNK